MTYSLSDLNSEATSVLAGSYALDDADAPQCRLWPDCPAWDGGGSEQGSLFSRGWSLDKPGSGFPTIRDSNDRYSIVSAQLGGAVYYWACAHAAAPAGWNGVRQTAGNPKTILGYSDSPRELLELISRHFHEPGALTGTQELRSPEFWQNACNADNGVDTSHERRRRLVAIGNVATPMQSDNPVVSPPGRSPVTAEASKVYYDHLRVVKSADEMRAAPVEPRDRTRRPGGRNR